MKNMINFAISFLIVLLFSNCQTTNIRTSKSKKIFTKETYNPDEIIMVVELKLNSGDQEKIEDFCEKYKNEVDKVEPNTLGWGFFKSDKNNIILVERYKNSEATLNHVDLFVSQNGPNHFLFKEFVSLFEVESIVVYGNVSETLKKSHSLSGFPFTYKSLISGYSR